MTGSGWAGWTGFVHDLVSDRMAGILKDACRDVLDRVELDGDGGGWRRRSRQWAQRVADYLAGAYPPTGLSMTELTMLTLDIGLVLLDWNLHSSAGPTGSMLVHRLRELCGAVRQAREVADLALGLDATVEPARDHGGAPVRVTYLR